MKSKTNFPAASALLLTVALLLPTGNAAAQDAKSIARTYAAASATPVLLVSLPWVRAAPGANSAEAYLTVTSTDGAALVGASSTAAKRVRFAAPDGKTVAQIALPANVEVALAPGAYRIVLTQLARTLKRGDRVPVTLTIESGGGTRQELEINTEVRRRSVLEDEMRAHLH